MTKTLAFRFQEWRADRLPWVQYPRVSGPRPMLFEYSMPWYRRVALVIFGAFVLAVAIIGMAALAFIAWALASA